MKSKIAFVSIILFVTLFSTHGQLMVNSSGLVGINSTSPTYMLSIKGKTANNIQKAWNWNASANPLYLINTSSNYPYFRLYSNDGSTISVLLNSKTDTANASYFLGDLAVGMTNPDSAYSFQVNGTIKCSGIYSGSDGSLKENINDIDNALNKILQLRGVTYNFKKDEIRRFPEGKQYGLVAQEVLNIIPEIVKFDEYVAPESAISGTVTVSNDSATYEIEPKRNYFTSQENSYSLNYIGIIPVLIEALKEQQNIIEEIQDELTTLKSESNIKSTLLSSDQSIDESNTSILYQNKPNPFDTDTEIQFFLPESINRATINIYDLSGTQIKNYLVTNRTKGSHIIRAEEFSPGMYLYSLITDGDLVETKRMILTDY